MSTAKTDQSIEGIAKDSSIALGQYGAAYVSGTSTTEGSFGCITAIEDSVFATLTATNWSGSSTASLPIKAGTTIFGSFTAFQLTSGKVIAYRDK